MKDFGWNKKGGTTYGSPKGVDGLDIISWDITTI